MANANGLGCEKASKTNELNFKNAFQA